MIAGSGHGCSSVTRFSFVCCGSTGMSRGTGLSAFGTRAKYWFTRLVTVSVSKSPTIISVAFSGT